jgi:hypothetical protein
VLRPENVTCSYKSTCTIVAASEDCILRVFGGISDAFPSEAIHNPISSFFFFDTRDLIRNSECEAVV